MYMFMRVASQIICFDVVIFLDHSLLFCLCSFWFAICCLCYLWNMFFEQLMSFYSYIHKESNRIAVVMHLFFLVLLLLFFFFWTFQDVAFLSRGYLEYLPKLLSCLYSGYVLHLGLIEPGSSAGFVGDSLNRNMFVSLFCTLKRVSNEVKKWRPAGADRGFTFLNYNLTISYHRTNLLARYGR